MKILATILNIFMLGFFIFLLFTEGWPKKPFEIFLASILFLTPVINLIVIYSKTSENFIYLYFKRKTLEEKLKIEKLNKEKEN